MPLPMVPAPRTATVLMESMDKLPPFANEIEDAWDADGGQAEEVVSMNLLRWDTFGDLANNLAGSGRARPRNVNDGQLAIICHANGNFVFLQGGGHERKDSGVVSRPNRHGGLFLGGRGWLRIILRRFILGGKFHVGEFAFAKELFQDFLCCGEVGRVHGGSLKRKEGTSRTLR